MPNRLLTISSALGLTVAGTVGALAVPATAAPRPTAPVTTSVDVPVTCTFAPESTIRPAFAATVKLTAPATVRPFTSFPVTVQVVSPIGKLPPVPLLGLGFTSTITAAGARPSTLTLTQAPVDVPTGSIADEIFTRRLRAGRTGSTITYSFTQYSYTFAIATGDPNLRIVSTCTPDTGGPVTLATTRVTGRNRH